ncbi:MAG TPA: rubrerythrin family protein [Firmicutes bacterium]|nr:rubrerythrin family protein [Bacillota bacterium]HAW70610.1 rubrerythrin family protein [Bacillota bacterium]HAZ22888.1 rubrerythrin family protein [Bacillota bacterium]HBE06104.1 rubrerythrin family protein [Bacillota bacterium]HBG43192.1 rubrerythrin family protein [Bacillota bacterium]
MTVQQDLEQAVAAVKMQLGMYAKFESDAQDQSTKSMYNEMSQDVQRHLDSLNTRLSYLEKNNLLNQQDQQKP